MLEELRISQLGVIESSTLELGPGLTVITGETGAGKTMVVTALGLLLGGRADPGAVRSGAEQARVEGVVAASDLAGFRTAVEDAGGEVEEDQVVLARNVAARGALARLGRRRVGAGDDAGRGRRAPRGRARPVRPAPPAPVRCPACLARPVRRRGAGRDRVVVRRSVGRAGRDRARRSPRWSARLASARGRPTSCGSASARSRRSTRTPGRTPSSPPRRRASGSPTRCAPLPRRPARRSPARRAHPTPWPRPARRGGRSTACATTTRRPGSSPTGSPS